VTVLLGTVALEPNRWRRGDPIDLAPLLDGIAAAGFDGIELWERHLSDDVLAHPLPITVFNSYVSFDDEDPSKRDEVAARVANAGSTAVKVNVGNDPTQQIAYAERLAAFVDALPDGVLALCECHAGISIAEDPVLAAAIFDAAGDGVGAIVHTHESEEHLRTRFDAYGDRIRHVHINHLDGGVAPKLHDARERFERSVAVLRSLGFDGTWTVEFVAGDSVEQAAEDLALVRELVG
jgi:sugar phosphate isomerase/epimerase